MNAKLTSLLLLAGAASLPAQTDRVAPKQYANTWGGNNGTGTVFGGTKGIMQGLYIAPMQAGLLFAVGFRRTAGTTDYSAVTLDAEVLVSSTDKTLATLTNTFANNLGNDATVIFTRKMLNVAARPANSSPNDWIVIPAARPWTFRGPNLIVQVKKFASSWSSTGWRNDRCFETTNRGGAITLGRACGRATHTSTSSSNYLATSPVNLTLSGAPANTPALMFLGFDFGSFQNIPLPLDMKVVGMPTCLLRVAPTLIFGTTTNATGSAQISLPIPTGVSNVSFGTQFFYVDRNAGNQLGALMTTARHIMIGPLPCANRYVWDLFDEAKATGSLQAGGPIVLLRTRP